MGGLTKEWFLLLVRQIFHTDYGRRTYLTYLTYPPHLSITCQPVCVSLSVSPLSTSSFFSHPLYFSISLPPLPPPLFLLSSSSSSSSLILLSLLSSPPLPLLLFLILLSHLLSSSPPSPPLPLLPLLSSTPPPPSPLPTSSLLLLLLFALALLLLLLFFLLLCLPLHLSLLFSPPPPLVLFLLSALLSTAVCVFGCQSRLVRLNQLNERCVLLVRGCTGKTPNTHTHSAAPDVLNRLRLFLPRLSVLGFVTDAI